MGLRSFLLTRLGPRERLVRRRGIRYRADVQDFVYRSILKTGAWEPRQTRTLIRLCEAHGVGAFLDVGAYFGYYAVHLARRFPRLRIVAFEAAPEAFARLQDHLALNDLADRVDARPFAVSDGTAATVNLDLFDDTRRGHTRVAGSGPEAAAPGPRVSVPATSLDAACPELRGGAVALKVDVEGHEAAVLRGARALLDGNTVVLQVELFPDRREAVLEDLLGRGFTCVRRIGDDHFLVRERDQVRPRDPASATLRPSSTDDAGTRKPRRSR